MEPHEFKQMLDEYHASQTQQLQAIREESKPKVLPQWLESWLETPGKIAGAILGLATLASIIFAAVTAGGRIYTAPKDIEATNAEVEALKAHHHEEEATFKALATNDSTILANQDFFRTQVGENTTRQKFLFCRGAKLDSLRGFADSIPNECRADWEQSR
jgi:hypothetical protein